MMDNKFPKNFLWGAATSSYQVEGNNSFCDWWDWELKGKLEFHSGIACNHYELYQEDFDIAKALGHNCHRFSIEWSRVEKEEGIFDEKELNHYRDVVRALRERNLEPVVTLHHFTNPNWLLEKGGWDNPEIVDYFLRYVEKIVSYLADDVTYWVTINEPMVFVYNSYLLGIWPPQKKSFSHSMKVMRNLIKAHNKAFSLIHKIYKDKLLAKPRVGIAKNTRLFMPCLYKNYLINKLAARFRDRFFNQIFLDAIKKHSDFIGVNYYTRDIVIVKNLSLNAFWANNCGDSHHIITWRNSLGWETYPEGIFDSLVSLKKYNLPILITENGSCQEKDENYFRFIYEHLKYVKKAIDLGVPVIGYIYWSLMDNFEWDKGFGPRFGLVEVDYNSLKRTIRKSAWDFSTICKNNSL